MSGLERLAAELSDRYRIERELGKGGMATVYLAHDLKHDRDVAIKVLHEDLGATLGPERFLAEIKTTAKLQHPHILPLLDSGEAGGLLFYVMPFVVGETLRERLTRDTQLSIADAVRIAREIGDALGAAHALGIIHRDIKPENILLQGGHALVADFGIALAVQQAGGVRMTQTGLSLGTPQYMSPEQAMGDKTVDLRADIYALGAVTYEMLTGDPPFTGSSVQAIVAKVLSADPERPTLVRKTIPPEVEGAVLTALAKLPADRFATAGEFAAALTNPVGTMTRAAGQRTDARGISRRTFGALTTALVAMAAVVALMAYRWPSIVPPKPVRFVVTAKGAAEPLYTLGWPAAVSPDGRTVVYAGAVGNGTFQYYARDVGRLESRPVPGTVGAYMPLFSPDGKWLAFQAQDGKIKKVSLDGGAPVPLVEYAEGNGMAWAPRGTIVVGAGIKSFGLSLVSTNGGTLTPLTKPDSAIGSVRWHIWPVMLADGRTIVFTVWKGFNQTRQAELAITSLDDGVVHPIGVRAARALGIDGNNLIYLTVDGVVMATRLDLAHYRAEGSPVTLIDSIPMCPTCNGDGAASLFAGGALSYMRGSTGGRLIWMGQDHIEKNVGAAPGVMRTPRLSPDAARIAVELDADGHQDIWIYQIATSTMGKLTSAGDNAAPEWTPDGRSIQFLSDRGGEWSLWNQPIDGSSDPRKIFPSGNGGSGSAPALHALEWGFMISPDGRHAVVQSSEASASINLYSATIGSDTGQHVFAGGIHNAWGGRFSPSGTSVAFVSDESGRPEVFVQPFPGPGARVQISVAGGYEPVWSRDGQHLYYVAGNQLAAAEEGTFTGVRLTPEPGVSVASRDSLFSAPFSGTSFSLASYDVARDGRFLMIKPNEDHLQLVVTLNFTSEVAARLGKP